jgi:GNAT superfamily N-acetyltransferase
MSKAFSGRSHRLQPAIGFRTIRESDASFLLALYATTRADELEMVPWSEEEKAAFVDMQFKAQNTFYHEQFPQAEFLLVEREGVPIGRVYVNREADQLRLIDISLIPEQRGQGLGTSLLLDLLDEAESVGLPVCIHVEQFNPAYRLYRRLGFEPIADKGLYKLLEWRPGRVKRDSVA